VYQAPARPPARSGACSPVHPLRGGSDALQSFLAAAPLPQRLGLRLLLALGRRPRGAAFLTVVPALSQVVRSVLAMERYDEPALSAALGFDAQQTVERGRALRRAEGRP
jgi:hypothetical protein